MAFGGDAIKEGQNMKINYKNNKKHKLEINSTLF